MKRTITNPMAALLLLALGLSGCSKHDDEITDHTWNGEIRLSSGITAQTRAANDVPDRQIAANKTVLFFVDDATTHTMLYQNYGLTANGSGGFTKYAPIAEDMYYPATGNGVDIYAFAGGFLGSPEFPASAITHTVSSDQSLQHGDNYLASDLLYAAKTGVARTKDAVNLTFYHMLSKVEVALKTGAGSPNLMGAVVTIESTQLKADFLPNKTQDINNATTGQATRAAMVTPTATGNTAAPIKIGTSIESGTFNDATLYASAVVVPQTVTQNKRFIKVTLADGGVLYYTIPNVEGLALESGNKYQFRVTVNLTGLTVQSTIADWATGTPITGAAEMPGPIGTKRAAQAVMGDFYFSDGTLEDKDATLTAEQQAACIGIVLKAGKDNSDLGTYKDMNGNDMPTINGYVVALRDAGRSLIWEDKDNDGNTGVKVGVSTSETDWNGYSNSQQIRQYATSTGGWTLADFPAANACFNFGTTYSKYAVPSGNSGWFMPSAGQLKYLYNNRDALSQQIEKLKGVSGISDISWFSSVYYWSSSELQGDSNYAMLVGFDYGYVGTRNKGGNGLVRAVSAF